MKQQSLRAYDAAFGLSLIVEGVVIEFVSIKMPCGRILGVPL